MHKELKIVITIVLVYVVFGLNSLIVNGGFVTPFLYSKFILFGTSITFLLMNLRMQGIGWLVWSFLAYLSLTLVDEFSIGYLDQLFQTSAFDEMTGSKVFIYGALVCFYGFLFAQLIPFYTHLKHKASTVMLLCVLTVHLLLFVNGLAIYAYVVLNLYLFGYFLIFNRLFKGDKTVVDVLSAQGLGLMMLEFFKFAV
jgi:hypothetical protein